MYQEIHLNNKLRIVLLKSTDIHTVNIGFFIGAGSKNADSLHNYGCAHFLEHMFFKGTKNISTSKLAEILDDLGGYANAYTNNEFTVFHNKVLREDAKKALDIFYEMIFNNSFKKEDIEKEKKVINEEINMYEDEPSSLILEEFSKNLFKGNGLGNSILGEKEYVKDMNKKILSDFHKKYYSPQNIILVITGNYNEGFIEYTKDKLNGLRSFLLPANEEEEKINNFGFKLYEKEKLSQIYFALGTKALGKNDPNYLKIVLLNNIIGGNSSSYLFQKLREELSLCYDISSFTTAFKKTGEMVITGGVNENRFNLALREIFAILNKIMAEGIAKKDFLRGQKQLKRQIVMSWENMHNLMFNIGIDVLYYDKPKMIEEVIESIDEIDYADFNSFAKEYIKASQMNLCVLAPKGSGNLEKIWKEIGDPLK